MCGRYQADGRLRHCGNFRNASAPRARLSRWGEANKRGPALLDDSEIVARVYTLWATVGGVNTPPLTAVAE